MKRFAGTTKSSACRTMRTSSCSTPRQVSAEDRARAWCRAAAADVGVTVPRAHTAGIRKLASIVDSKKRLRMGGLGKVMARNTVLSTTGASILTSMRAKRYRDEIYQGSGVQSAPGKPYVPFEVGVGFMESSKASGEEMHGIREHIRSLTASMKGFEVSPVSKGKPQTAQRPGTIKVPDDMLEIELGRWFPAPDPQTKEERWLSAKRYERRVFYLDLTKCPRSQVRGKSISVTLESNVGDPDLYMAIAEPPTEKEYTWRSVREGSDLILIHPQDPNYVYGIYYIGVSCPSSDSSFKVLCLSCPAGTGVSAWHAVFWQQCILHRILQNTTSADCQCRAATKKKKHA